ARAHRARIGTLADPPHSCACDPARLVEILVMTSNWNYLLSGAAVAGVCAFTAACGSEARSATAQQAGSPIGAPAPAAEFSVDTATVRLPLELPAQLYVEHDAVVVARSAGTIDGLYAELGDRVGAGQLGVGDSASISAGTGFDYQARIVHATPFVDAGSGTREVVVEVARPGGALLAGSSVTVRLGHEPRHVVTAPRAAIASDGYAVAVDNGRSTLRSVTVGRDVGNGRVEILSGLTSGERLARPPH